MPKSTTATPARKLTVQKPLKPLKAFEGDPLFAHATGQWAKRCGGNSSIQEAGCSIKDDFRTCELLIQASHRKLTNTTTVLDLSEPTES